MALQISNPFDIYCRVCPVFMTIHVAQLLTFYKDKEGTPLVKVEWPTFGCALSPLLL